MTDENRKNPGIKIPHINIENSPIVEGFRCITVYVPDDDRYVALLSGLVAIPTKWFNWQRDATHKGKLLANQWQAAYALTDWEGCMNCEDVADCIENNEAVQEALEQNLIDNINNSADVQTALNNVYNQYGVNPMPEDVTATDIMPPTVLCDADKMWGAVNQLIESMHTNNLDSFEAAEELTDFSERVSMLLSAIPIFETLPVDEFIDYVQGIWTDDLFEAYVANDTTIYRDTLKCDLFCIAVNNNCVLTIDDVYDYFLLRISADPANDLIQLIAYLAAGTWTGTQVNDMFFAGQILIMKYGNQFFNTIGIRPFQTYMEIGSRNPSNDWTILCDCGWYSEMDVTADMYTWQANPEGFNWGNWTDTIGFISGFDVSEGNAYQMVQIKLDFAAPASVQRMAFDYDLTSGTQVFGLVLNVGTDNVNVGQTDVPANGTDLTYDKTMIDTAANSITLRCQAGFQTGSSSDPGGQSIVKRIRVWGLGVKPDELP